ncbi:MAG: helix-turn-helix domain-containing protein [Bacteroidales bacterium]|nr:helix-turn-helix domain-containing protein [Bacteroidales bacterium]
MTDEEYRSISERLERIETLAGIGGKEVLTIQEASAYTGYKVSSLYKMTQRAVIPHYRQLGRVFFRKRELEAWLTARRVRSAEESRTLAALLTPARGRTAKGKAKVTNQQ